MKRNLVFATALIGSLWVVLLTIIGGATFEGYSHISQYISELGARDAPQEMLIRFGGFLPAAIILSIYVYFAFSLLPRSKLASIGLLGVFVYSITYLVAVFYPCDPGCRPTDPSAAQLIHNIVGSFGYLTLPISLLLLGIRAKSWEGGKRLSIISFIASIISFAGLVTFSPESPYVGISQRLIEGSALTWIMASATYIRNGPAPKMKITTTGG